VIIDFQNATLQQFKTFLNDSKSSLRVYGHIDSRLDDNDGFWKIYEGKYDLSKDDTQCVSFIRGDEVKHFYINCVFGLVRDDIIKLVVDLTI